jgi:CBS domain-containing protein
MVMAALPGAGSEAQLSAATPLSAVMRREPVSCAPDTPLRSALEMMRSRSIGSMIVTDADRTPVGIFTLRDVLDRVALAADTLERPISAVMSRDIFTLPTHATVYDAVLTMLRHGFRHILVVEAGKLAGLVSEKDLFSLQRVSMRQLAGAIREAAHLDHLVAFSVEVREHARKLLTQGVAAEPLTQFIASLNDLLTQRIIDLEFADFVADGIRLCWIALGSEGRQEQTLYTDQDNGIIFAAGGEVEAARARLLDYAQRVNQSLARCGFPLCPGNIMAGNPRWCLTLEEWQERFASWIDRGDPEALLHGAIFFDFRALHGDSSLADALRQWLIAHAQRTPRFLHQMAANALRNRPPLGVIRDFVTSGEPEHPHTIDLKLNGAILFTDAARIYSLAGGLPHTNTCERLRQFGALREVPQLEIEAWVDAFLFIQILRLRRQHADSQAGCPLTNRIDPDELNEVQRQTLREALRQARRLQQRLALDYQL